MLGDGGMEKLLAGTVEVGFGMEVIAGRSLENVNIDTTVQEKAITYPADARLFHAMLKKLTKLAKRRGVELRQSYGRVSRKALVRAGRYFHARQNKRAMREVRRLKTMLGRVIRDIGRKIAGNAFLEQFFAEVLAFATRLDNQEKNDKNEIYSIHAPETATSREGFVIGALGLRGNPSDGHTLPGAIEQAERLCGDRKLGRVFVDQGYKGHGYAGDTEIHIRDRRKLPPGLRRHARRRSAIEPIIGHMKNDGRLGRNSLRGIEGDRINAVLCAVGRNLRLLLRFIVGFFVTSGKITIFSPFSSHFLALHQP
jgi:IS5 family transposase